MIVKGKWRQLLRPRGSIPKVLSEDDLRWAREQWITGLEISEIAAIAVEDYVFKRAPEPFDAEEKSYLIADIAIQLKHDIESRLNAKES